MYLFRVEMSNLSSTCENWTEDEEDVSIMAAPPNERRDTESRGATNRLAFTYDLSKLDEEGRPKKKLARR